MLSALQLPTRSPALLVLACLLLSISLSPFLSLFLLLSHLSLDLDILTGFLSLLPYQLVCPSLPSVRSRQYPRS